MESNYNADSPPKLKYNKSSLQAASRISAEMQTSQPTKQDVSFFSRNKNGHLLPLFGPTADAEKPSLFRRSVVGKHIFNI